MGFGDERLQHGGRSIEHFRTKRLHMEANRRLAVRQRRIITVALTNHDTFQAQRIGHESIKVFFHNNLYSFHN